MNPQPLSQNNESDCDPAPRVTVTLERVKVTSPCRSCMQPLRQGDFRVHIQYSNVKVPSQPRPVDRSFNLHLACFRAEPIDFVKVGPAAWTSHQRILFFPLKSYQQVQNLVHHPELREFFHEAVRVTTSHLILPEQRGAEIDRVRAHLMVTQSDAAAAMAPQRQTQPRKAAPAAVSIIDQLEEEDEPGLAIQQHATPRREAHRAPLEQEERKESPASFAAAARPRHLLPRRRAAAAPAGAVDDQLLYVKLPAASRLLGFAQGTLRTWAKKGLITSMRGKGRFCHLHIHVEDARNYIATRTKPVMPRRPTARRPLRILFYGWIDTDQQASAAEIEAALDEQSTQMLAAYPVAVRQVDQCPMLVERCPASMPPYRRPEFRRAVMRLILRREIDVLAVCKRSYLCGGSDESYRWLTYLCRMHHVSIVCEDDDVYHAADDHHQDAEVDAAPTVSDSDDDDDDERMQSDPAAEEEDEEEKDAELGQAMEERRRRQ